MQNIYSETGFYKNMTLLLKEYQSKEKSQLHLKRDICKLTKDNTILKSRLLELESEIARFNVFFKEKLDSIDSLVLNEVEFEQVKTYSLASMITLVDKLNSQKTSKATSYES